MISVDVFDSLWPRQQVPFAVHPSAGGMADYYLRLGRVTVYLRRARLAELHAVIGAALAATPEAPVEAAPERALPTIQEMSGLVDDFTDGKPLKEYLEAIRDLGDLEAPEAQAPAAAVPITPELIFAAGYEDMA